MRAGLALLLIYMYQSVTAHSAIRLSLAEWSVHRAIENGQLDHLDFPRTAREVYGFEAVEYVSGLFGSGRLEAAASLGSPGYLQQLLRNSTNAGVVNHLLMIDHEGPLAGADTAARLRAIDGHRKWLDAAAFLGCRHVRVNLHGEGTRQQKFDASVDSLLRLAQLAGPMGLNVLVENHGNESSDANWLVAVMQRVGLPTVGTLPDFGNFCLTHAWGTTQEPCGEAYDRYQGVEQLMPYAKAVSAKSYDFDENGLQPLIDYERLLAIVTRAGFAGYIGVEFEGFTQDEPSGIKRTRALLEKYLMV